MGKHCVFIFHGSKSIEAQSATDNLTEQLHKKLKTSFSICYLTNNNPNLYEALESAVLKGATEILCFPLFVLPGQHICKDIPSIIDDFKKTHKKSVISLLPSLVENIYFADFLVNVIETSNDK